ncbi:hypothetical protein B0A50_06678 [Salinomyces thailandicus]|uniref:J domain-containing protein n=1 Tax=Salinomyces thailandicus TaxID=706561 RepID=A0A4U0TQW4_9PEZI|nr:hypothetical protein B0A50_06678 [Salinomyces thailandica]
MSSEYKYDADAQFFPFFVLPVAALITLPLTYSLLRRPSDTTTKAAHIPSPAPPDHADLIAVARAKQKRKEVRLKRMLTAATGWLVMAYMVYLMVVTARSQPKVWNPYDILDVSLSASEKQINSRYRRLSVTMHPDKRQPNPALNETMDVINNEWVEIVKAYKALTDEEVRNNYVQYGNPDGKQSTSFGIALPSILVAEGSGKYVLVFYGALLGIGLPWLVGKWWYGMQKVTRERVLVTSAGNMFQEYRERMDVADVVNAVSSALEYRDLLHGAKEHGGLGKLEKRLLQAAEKEGADSGMPLKDRKRLGDLEDPVRRKTFAMVWAYLTRLDLDDKTLEAEKYELAPTALQMNEAFLSICLAYGFTAPVLASYHLTQCLTQSIPPTNRHPLLQLPHFTPSIISTIERHTKDTQPPMTIQAFMALPPAHRRALATTANLPHSHLAQAETLATQLPHLQVLTAFFKVQGEPAILPSSLVQFVLKARFIPPGTDPSHIPTIDPSTDLADPDPPEGDLAAQKQEQESHPLPLTHAPFLARDRAPCWHVFLADNRQGKIAVPPFTFANFDKPAFKVQEDGTVEPTFEVVTLKMQFQAPPQPGEYKFRLEVVCEAYLGFDHRQEAVMRVESPEQVAEKMGGRVLGEESESEISEPGEDSIAGAMATMRGQPTADSAEAAARKARRAERRVANESKKMVGSGGAGGGGDAGDESEYESGTDEDEESGSGSETDTETDSEGE